MRFKLQDALLHVKWTGSHLKDVASVVSEIIANKDKLNQEYAMQKKSKRAVHSTNVPSFNGVKTEMSPRKTIKMDLTGSVLVESPLISKKGKGI